MSASWLFEYIGLGCARAYLSYVSVDLCLYGYMDCVTLGVGCMSKIYRLGVDVMYLSVCFKCVSVNQSC